MPIYCHARPRHGGRGSKRHGCREVEVRLKETSGCLSRHQRGRRFVPQSSSCEWRHNPRCGAFPLPGSARLGRMQPCAANRPAVQPLVLTTRRAPSRRAALERLKFWFDCADTKGRKAQKLERFSSWRRGVNPTPRVRRRPRDLTSFECAMTSRCGALFLPAGGA